MSEKKDASNGEFTDPKDNTVENAEEMGAGYGGPEPVTPEDEQA
ncbi:hypothetical protein OH146_08350 [Salinibacterium sp. SYSU T00001]|nr:hypothetical protein [Salinibacterium sedimenticola]MCW4385785.1 hypothetical protein [Salinibacterium sedimenticola]